MRRAFSSTFGIRTFCVSLVLLAIADVNRPYRGWVHVDSYAFVRAQENMKD